MSLSILQLNMNADNHWKALIDHLTNNQYDILTFQELAGKGTKMGNINCTHDTYLELHKHLQQNYFGEFILSDHIDSADTAYFGNAIFYKKHFKLIDKRLIYLHKTQKAFPSTATRFEKIGRSMLHLTLADQTTHFSILTTHFGWARRPIEESHQTQQGKILLNYIQSIQAPFILTGDFNLTPDQPTIEQLSSITTNLTQKYAIANTLNPRIHRAKHLFPKGFPIDYIFVSKDILSVSMEALTTDLSDHLALHAKIEL